MILLARVVNIKIFHPKIYSKKQPASAMSIWHDTTAGLRLSSHLEEWLNFDIMKEGEILWFYCGLMVPGKILLISISWLSYKNHQFGQVYKIYKLRSVTVQISKQASKVFRLVCTRACLLSICFRCTQNFLRILVGSLFRSEYKNEAWIESFLVLNPRASRRSEC